MIREKIYNLRFGLLVIGCTNAAFWLSWLITGVLFSAFMSAMMCASGYAFNFEMFTDAPIYIMFNIIFVTCIAHVTLAMCLVTMMET